MQVGVPDLWICWVAHFATFNAARLTMVYFFGIMKVVFESLVVNGLSAILEGKLVLQQLH